MGTRQEAKERTRQALLEVALQAFIEDGYEACGISDIAARAKLTTGAVYHHFDGKKGLFEQVIEGVMAELAQDASADMDRHEDPWDALKAVTDVILEASQGPKVRLAFLGAPAIMGLQAWRELELRYTSPVMAGALQRLIAQEALPRWDAEVLGRVLRGAAVEGAMAIAESANPAKTGKEVRAMLHLILDSFRGAQ